MAHSKNRPPIEADAFVLTRDFRETPRGIELEFWLVSERGPFRVLIRDQEAVCFMARSTELPAAHSSPRPRRRTSPELRSLAGEPVDALYFGEQRQLRSFREAAVGLGLRLHESDLFPTDRYLMERFITGGVHFIGELSSADARVCINPRMRSSEFVPDLKIASIDIETDARANELLSIALTCDDVERVFLRRSPEWPDPNDPRLAAASLHDDERSLLRAFMGEFGAMDPDLVIGWNVIDFDLRFLAERCRHLGLTLTLARGGAKARILPRSGDRRRARALLAGRIVLDGIEALRTAGHSFEELGLEAVAREVLGRGKLLGGTDDAPVEGVAKIDEIRRLYREAPHELVAYNLEDCRLVAEIFSQLGLTEFLLRRAQLTGLALDRPSASMAAFDNLYLPRLHRRGFVAPDVDLEGEVTPSPGGHVMDSQPGLFRNVVVLDFKSLYPSIIRTFLIDPLGLLQEAPGVGQKGVEAVTESDERRVPGFLGASFSRDQPILPSLIADLWDARDQAKAARDAPLSTAIKLIMNSFYGVLGSRGCRFFDPRLASSITMRGHEILGRTKEQIEALGYPVIYGDTDSLFVLLGPEPSRDTAEEIGRTLEARLNDYWTHTVDQEMGLTSHLQLEFETLYLRFFMPTLRGSAKGSKKRYAGLVEDEEGLELRIRGMESVRSDWTALAREFQREIFRRVFLELPYVDHVRETVTRMRAGELDDRLVYRKRLRKPLDSYVKNIPPHVQAARKMKRPGRWIHYTITAAGPEPVSGDGAASRSKLDYDHYLTRQLAPAVDPLLQLLGTSVGTLVDAQLRMF
jgi:DNA polymerase-2